MIHAAANYIDPAITFSLVSLIVPTAVAVEIGRKGSTTSGTETSEAAA